MHMLNEKRPCCHMFTDVHFIEGPPLSPVPSCLFPALLLLLPSLILFELIMSRSTAGAIQKMLQVRGQRETASAPDRPCRRLSSHSGKHTGGRRQNADRVVRGRRERAQRADARRSERRHRDVVRPQHVASGVMQRTAAERVQDVRRLTNEVIASCEYAASRNALGRLARYGVAAALAFLEV